MTNPISLLTPNSTAAFAAATSAVAVRPSADPAPTAQPARVDSPQPVPQRHQEFEVDKSGLTVVMTFDESNGALVSQYPTEAYLRLANAMQNLVKSDVPAIDPNAGRTA